MTFGGSCSAQRQPQVEEQETGPKSPFVGVVRNDIWVPLLSLLPLPVQAQSRGRSAV